MLVEVNTAADPVKYGVAPDELDAFLELLAGPRARRGARPDDDAGVRGGPRRPRGRPSPRCASWPPRAAERWAGTHAFDVLSMGTSQDFAVAVEEGATLVRLGSVLLRASRPMG